MILWPVGTKIWLSNIPVDFRKSINGLTLIISEHFKMNPGSGSVYVFFNKRRNALKVLYYDLNGFMLWHKRLNKGRFKCEKRYENKLSLDEQQLKWLLSGLDFMALKQLPAFYQKYA